MLCNVFCISKLQLEWDECQDITAHTTFRHHLHWHQSRAAIESGDTERQAGTCITQPPLALPNFTGKVLHKKSPGRFPAFLVNCFTIAMTDILSLLQRIADRTQCWHSHSVPNMLLWTFRSAPNKSFHIHVYCNDVSSQLCWVVSFIINCLNLHGDHGWVLNMVSSCLVTAAATVKLHRMVPTVVR